MICGLGSGRWAHCARDGGDWWALVEPNGFRASVASALSSLAASARAGSFFWNVNAVMRVVLVATGGEVVADFDPLLQVESVPEWGRDLPFGDQPRAS